MRTSLGGAEAGGDAVKFRIGSVAKPLRAPFGISDQFAGDAATDRRTMDLELKDPRVDTWAHSLDEAVVSAGVQHSKEWFGERLPEAAVRAMHTSLVKPPSKAGYPSLLRVKVNVGDDGDKATKIYKRTGPNTAKGGTKSDVKKRALVVPSVTLSSVMFLNKKFSVSLNCDQLMVVLVADGCALYSLIFSPLFSLTSHTRRRPDQAYSRSTSHKRIRRLLSELYV